MIELRPESQVTVSTKFNCWRRRTLLEKKLLTGVVLVAGVIISFLIDATLHWHKKPTRPCDSDQCIIASSDIINQIDETMNPCDDFYKFACGKLESRTHLKDVAKETIKNQVEKQLIDILIEPIADDDHPSLKYEKNLFIACRKEATDGTTLKGLKAIFKGMGGWPVLMGDKWNESNFKLVEIIENLRKGGLYHNSLLQVYLTEEPPERNITVVNGPLSLSSKDEYLHLYKKLMFDQAIALGANESIAKEDMSRAFDFMVELNNLNIENENNTEPEILRLSILELQVKYKGMDWLKYFQVVQEPINMITEDDYVVFPHVNFPQQFLNLMSATNHRTLANYIMWTAAFAISSVVSNELLDLYNRVLCFMDIPNKDLNAECLEEINNVMYPTPSFFVYLNRHLSTSSRKAVQEMFQLIIKELEKLISKNSWIDEESKNKSYEWLQGVEGIIGYNATTVDDIYKKIYKPFDKNDSFLTSYLKLNIEYSLEESTNERMLSYSSVAYFRPAQIDIFYWNQKIRIPAGLLQGIYFEEYRPMYMNYGVLGKFLGLAVADTFIDSISQLWSEETMEIFVNKTNCISHNWKYIKDEENIRMRRRSHEKQFKIAQIIGTQLSYNAYESWRSKNSEELDLIGLNYTNVQLFWISTFADLCFEENLNTDYNFFSENEVVRQNFNFATDFHCHLDSKMNSKNKCTLLY
ncbi:hypothetical protein FQR65_LT06857 [Abscondita terminalis]|nr:hypothetical protein FQR65_LT06857 [Abscondita terminalis]